MTTTCLEKSNTNGGGVHTWTEDDIARFFEVHKPGTLPYLAATIMLFIGTSPGDAVELGWGNVKDGRISYRRQKTQRVSVGIDMSIHPELMAALEMTPCDADTFLQTRHGRSRTGNALTAMMRRWCDEAGLSECTSNGLRKACVRRMAEAGATTQEIAAVVGHATLKKEFERYTWTAEEIARFREIQRLGKDAHIGMEKPR